MNKLFFDSWESIVRTLVITVSAYFCLILLLRISGKRTLSKMNAFDFVVTVALGSTLATVLLNKSVSLADGVFTFFLLIAFQYLITWLSLRYKSISQLVKATPTLLVYKGQMLHYVMKKERVNEDELHAIVREKGLDSIQDADAIVLETDGSFTVVKRVSSLQTPTMQVVQKPGDLC